MAEIGIGGHILCCLQVPGLHWIFSLRTSVWQDTTGALDLVKESWEEGPSKVQYILDLRAKLHTLGQLSWENVRKAQECQWCLYRGTRSRQFATSGCCAHMLRMRLHTWMMQQFSSHGGGRGLWPTQRSVRLVWGRYGIGQVGEQRCTRRIRSL